MREWLIKIREEKGMTSVDVARAAGISQSHYWRIEVGQKQPSVHAAQEIGNVLGFNWTRFFEDSESGAASA